MNKMILGITGIVLAGCAAVNTENNDQKTEVESGIFSAYVLDKSAITYGYDKAHSLKYRVRMIINLPDYDYSHQEIYYNKALWDSVKIDDKIYTYCDVVSDNFYQDGRLMRMKFLGLRLDTAWREPRNRLKHTLYWDSKKHMYVLNPDTLKKLMGNKSIK